MSSWRSSTRHQYDTYIRRWVEFCKTNSYDSTRISVNIAVQFLTMLFESGLSYSAINTARSALSSFFHNSDNGPFANIPIIKRFMRGVYQLRPTLPRYQTVWNVHIVFDYIRSCQSVEHLNLKDLTLRLTFMLCLLSAQRRQTIKAFRIDNMDVTPSSYIFHLVKTLKQSRPGYHQQPIRFNKYDAEPKLCVYSCIAEYLKRTETLRSEINQLLITYSRPYRTASADTISRWSKQFLSLAGIDTSRYKCHSTRAAATSHAVRHNHAYLNDIMRAAGWSNEQVFRRFYDLPSEEQFNIGTALLSSAKD